MNCYNNFAYIYDDLINKDVDYKGWSGKIIELCKKYNINKREYLDIGCGTGNLTEEIASNFDICWCVDLSSDMLTEAEAKFRKKGLNVKLVCQNMIKLNLNRKFDLITCCLDSTNYILSENDLLEYFNRVSKHLKTDGIFIFDINSYYKLTEILGNNIYDYDDENITYIWDNSLEDEIVDMYLTFFIREGDMYRRFDEQHRERAYKCSRMEDILEKCGFNILDKLDNYEDKAPVQNSQRIVYILNKGDNR
ncbi:ubiquinone/menaquinone biosynthesis C-methylase UbiE [Clostridium algifaecis]|uniref:Ubiquinone/menaquinone biosynthesis C-methylase UbiE n=1 Tax=Clostridium algifaecis TaxID=1472040 RepID=A0ABS4KUD6_9CLOT|nr:class I SAM-dependent methyltransferase [Clostridium algifaecis]MBP2033640.1 ubiquinone/menaquinone biosynthesis C-methylase UbiE [Clostridium algifaecis]